MIYILIIGIIILIISMIALRHEATSIAYVLGILGSYLISGALMYLEITNKSPTVMDVYQGKTTLEYTYKDGVAIDSVVVFKDK